MPARSRHVIAHVDGNWGVGDVVVSLLLIAGGGDGFPSLMASQIGRVGNIREQV